MKPSGNRPSGISVGDCSAVLGINPGAAIFVSTGVDFSDFGSSKAGGGETSAGDARGSTSSVGFGSWIGSGAGSAITSLSSGSTSSMACDVVFC